MNLDQLILPSYAQMLEALAGQFAKATEQYEAEGKTAEDLLAARLAPDMFPLSKQIEFACLQAEEALARLRGDEIAAVTEPMTAEEAKSLLAWTIERLRTAAGNDQEADGTRPVALELPNGMNFDFDLNEYVRSWAQPQFYFHLITAYAIMRHHGAELGKADYVPHMFRFIRAEAS